MVGEGVLLGEGGGFDGHGLEALGDGFGEGGEGGEGEVVGEFEGGFGEVLDVELGRRKEVAGVGEVGEGGELDGEGGAHRTFEHAADPDGDAGVAAHVVDLDGAGEAAGAAGLDVDVLAGVDFEGLLDHAELAGGFVQTDGRLDLAGELGVVHDVVPLEGLFNKRQAKLVDGLEGVEVVEGVAGVAVDVKDGIRERSADGVEHLHIPAGAGLELDARKAGVDGFLNVGEEVIEGVEDAEVGAGDDVGVGAPNQGVQGGAGSLGFEGPPEEFDGGLGEAVAFEGGEAGIKVGGGVELAADNKGAEDFADEVVDGAGGFGDVVGGAEGRGLGPGGDVTRRGFDEDGVDGVVFAVGGSPGVDEGHADVVDVETVDTHWGLPDG